MNQSDQIKKLQKEIKDLKKRIKYNCWECLGKQSIDCRDRECAFYKIRPKSFIGYHK